MQDFRPTSVGGGGLWPEDSLTPPLTLPRYGVHQSPFPLSAQVQGGGTHPQGHCRRGNGYRCRTTMYLSLGMGRGDIILQAEEPIYPHDTAGTLHDRLMIKARTALAEIGAADGEAGTAPRIP